MMLTVRPTKNSIISMWYPKCAFFEKPYNVRFIVLHYNIPNFRMTCTTIYFWICRISIHGEVFHLSMPTNYSLAQGGNMPTQRPGQILNIATLNSKLLQYSPPYRSHRRMCFGSVCASSNMHSHAFACTRCTYLQICTQIRCARASVKLVMIDLLTLHTKKIQLHYKMVSTNVMPERHEYCGSCQGVEWVEGKESLMSFPYISFSPTKLQK